MNLIKRLWMEEEGQGMVEYGLIVAGIALVVLVAIWAFGDDLAAFFNGLGDNLTP